MESLYLLVHCAKMYLFSTNIFIIFKLMINVLMTTTIVIHMILFNNVISHDELSV